MIAQHVSLNNLFAGDDPVANTDIRIVVKKTGTVNQSRIYLGDIADIHASGFLKEAT